MEIKICTRPSTVTTTVELIGITQEEFEKAFNGEDGEYLDLDFIQEGSEVRIGKKLVGRVISVVCPIQEQFILGDESTTTG